MPRSRAPRGATPTTSSVVADVARKRGSWTEVSKQSLGSARAERRERGDDVARGSGGVRRPETAEGRNRATDRSEFGFGREAVQRLVAVEVTFASGMTGVLEKPQIWRINDSMGLS